MPAAAVLVTLLFVLGGSDDPETPVEGTTADGTEAAALGGTSGTAALPPPEEDAPSSEPAAPPPPPVVDAPPRPAPSAAAAAPPSPLPRDAILVLIHNDFRKMRMTVLLDGNEIWAHDPESGQRQGGEFLGDAKRFFRGSDWAVPIPITAEDHRLEVRLRDDKDVDLAETAAFGIASGETRHLRVVYRRRANELELDWGG